MESIDACPREIVCLYDPKDKRVTIKDLMSAMTSRSNRMFNFVVKKWPKTGKEMGVSIEDLEDAKERHEVIDLDQ